MLEDYKNIIVVGRPCNLARDTEWENDETQVRKYVATWNDIEVDINSDSWDWPTEGQVLYALIAYGELTATPEYERIMRADRATRELQYREEYLAYCEAELKFARARVETAQLEAEQLVRRRENIVAEAQVHLTRARAEFDQATRGDDTVPVDG